MNPLVIVSAVFLASVALVSGQNCITPTGASGKCQSILDCKPLAEILHQESRTPEEVEFLKKSQCGFQGNIPTVCCSSEATSSVCYDPNGNEGKCVDINQCKHLADMLKPPSSTQNKEFLQNSKCRGITPNSVCCGPEPVQGTVQQRTKTCKSSVSANPPDPASGCCGLDSSFGNRIYGGNITTVDQYPWLALIDYVKNGVTKQLCGGVLISGRYVLTAGHCVLGDILDLGTPRVVRLSEYDKSKDGPDCMQVANGMDCTDDVMKIPIEKIIPHPEYNPSKQYHDIALIKLANMAPYTDFIRPICLPSVDITKNPPENFTTFAAGWGEISPKVYSDIKMHVELPFVNLQRCQVAYTQPGLRATLWDKQICAGGEKGKDSCRGDSGGPLMFENGRTFEAIGVVSFGPKPCGVANTPGVYTKVIEYKDWILSNTKS